MPLVRTRCCSVEVGCGTGDVILSLAPDFKQSLGLDINDGFLAYASSQTPENLKHKVSLLIVVPRSVDSPMKVSLRYRVVRQVHMSCICSLYSCPILAPRARFVQQPDVFLAYNAAAHVVAHSADERLSGISHCVE